MRMLLVGVLAVALIGCSCPTAPHTMLEACTSKPCFYRTAASPPTELKPTPFKSNPTTTKVGSKNATKTAKALSVAAKATKPTSPQTSNGSDKDKVAIKMTPDSSAPPLQPVEDAKSNVGMNVNVAALGPATEPSDPILEISNGSDKFKIDSLITMAQDSSAPPPQAVESAKSIVETNLSVATSSQASEASDPVLEKAKTAVASKMENPASVEFEDMARAIRKPAESISMVHIAVGFLLVVLFCNAVKFIIHQTKNHNKKDSIRQLSVELDALKVEVDGLKRIREATAKTTEQWSVIPSTTSDVALEDTALGGGNGQSIQGDNPSLDEPVPTQPSTSADTWARDEGVYAAPQLPVRPLSPPPGRDSQQLFPR